MIKRSICLGSFARKSAYKITILLIHGNPSDREEKKMHRLIIVVLYREFMRNILHRTLFMWWKRVFIFIFFIRSTMHASKYASHTKWKKKKPKNNLRTTLLYVQNIFIQKHTARSFCRLLPLLQILYNLMSALLFVLFVLNLEALVTNRTIRYEQERKLCGENKQISRVYRCVCFHSTVIFIFGVVCGANISNMIIFAILLLAGLAYF